MSEECLATPVFIHRASFVIASKNCVEFTEFSVSGKCNPAPRFTTTHNRTLSSIHQNMPTQSFYKVQGLQLLIERVKAIAYPSGLQ